METPTQSVTVELGDGIERELRYSIKSLKRLKQHFGRSMIGLKGGLLEIDEEMLPELIMEGLRNSDGELPKDISIEQIAALPTYRIAYLIERFNQAFMGSSPQKKTGLSPDMAPATPRPN
jgi:hypothetical protein